MYEAYWKLSDKPFSNTPNPRYLYLSAGHEEALTRLLYAVAERKGGMLLTGDYGCGKTLASRVLLRELSPTRHEMAIISNPNLSPTELLQEILYQFGIPVRADANKNALLHKMEAFVRACEAAGRHPVLVIDEAQMVRDLEALEELRLLLNMQRDDRFLLTLVLMGQPELRTLVERLPQLKQRLTLRHHLGPLCESETVAYIRHRMARAGARQTIITPEAESAIHNASGGIPREINSCADLALLVGCGRKAGVVDPELVWEVIQDMAA
jgi:type II secretory pathway predicted ATPase ExeA